jgi:glycosyltransferase involved in cell wall biosynthesis
MEKTKKVLHIFNSINHSGAELMYEAAADIFIESGFNLYALSTGNDFGTFIDEFRNAGFNIKHFPFQRSYTAKYILNFIPYFYNIYKYINREGFSVLHIHRRHLFWAFALVGKLAGVPVVIRTIHNNFNPKWYRFPEYFFSRHFAKMIGVKLTSISDSVYENERKRFLNKTIKIYNWYNDKKFFPALENEKRKLRKRFNISEDTLVLISSGSCLPQKRHKDIINALFEIREDKKDVLYLHLGDGLLNKEEQCLAKELGLKNNIRFIGNVNNVREYLIASDFYIMPSEYEGIGIAAIEAIASKIPTLLYNSPGLDEIYADDELKDNLLKKDYHNISKRIMYLTKNKEESLRIVEESFKMVTKKFNMKNNVKNFIELYNA